MTEPNLRPLDLVRIREQGSSSVTVLLDEGFTCTGKGRTVISFDPVMQDWWFACREGRHWLAGQLDFDRERFDGDGEYYVGIYLDD